MAANGDYCQYWLINLEAFQLLNHLHYRKYCILQGMINAQQQSLTNSQKTNIHGFLSVIDVELILTTASFHKVFYFGRLSINISLWNVQEKSSKRKYSGKVAEPLYCNYSN